MESHHLNAKQLIDRAQQYIAVNLELFLQSWLLDDLPLVLTRQLSKFILQMQISKSPQSRGERLVFAALEKHADWLAMQDFPLPLVRSVKHRKSSRKRVSDASRSPGYTVEEVLHAPSLRLQPNAKMQLLGDEIFVMEDDLPAALPAETKKSVEACPPQKHIWGDVSSAPRHVTHTCFACYGADYSFQSWNG